MSGGPADTFDLVVVGGGAAGFFAAITAAETTPGLRVVILEKAPTVLGKVKISGGGRCNVTHACFDPRELAERYPRGGRSLIGPFHRWGPGDTVDWFESHGVTLKTETDGRIFPVSDDSQTVIDCLIGIAEAAGVRIWTRCEVADAEPKADETGEGWIVHLADGRFLEAGAVLVATGGVRGGIGAEIANGVGHRVEPPAPSLFTFKIPNDPRLVDLSGISVPMAEASVPGTKLRERGPILITHWGLSGPAILRLSSWGARELQERDYQFEVVIDWSGGRPRDQIEKELIASREAHARAMVVGRPSFGLPSRLWQRLVGFAGIAADQRWSNLTRDERQALGEAIGVSRFTVCGKATNKDEFVTCGGVSLKEVDFKTLESRLVPGLFFAGEVLDIDGITGGFNFQSAWTTGRLAGECIGAFAGLGKG